MSGVSSRTEYRRETCASAINLDCPRTAKRDAQRRWTMRCVDCGSKPLRQRLQHLSACPLFTPAARSMGPSRCLFLSDCPQASERFSVMTQNRRAGSCTRIRHPAGSDPPGPEAAARDASFQRCRMTLDTLHRPTCRARRNAPSAVPVSCRFHPSARVRASFTCRAHALRCTDVYECTV